MTHRYEPGCYGDGMFGHGHTRERCAEIFAECVEYDYHRREIPTPGQWDTDFGPTQLIASLNGDMPDDAWDEDFACDWLNEFAAQEGAYWGWNDGDFGLWSDEED